MPEPFKTSAQDLDFSPRFAQSSTVAGSPTTNAITNICSVTVPQMNVLAVATGVQLEGFCAVTIGTSGVSAKLDIRQTGTSGAVIATTGAVTVVAGNLYTLSIAGLDTAPLAAGVWIMALTIGSGAGTSTISAAQLTATVI